MSGFIDELKMRRSIRKYLPKPVPTELIKEILTVALYAPSAHNSQPWRFVILTQEKLKRNLAKAMAQAWQRDLKLRGVPEKTAVAMINASKRRFAEAPVLILVCMTMKEMVLYSDDLHQRGERDLAVQSVAAAIQNLLLAVNARGLGACWCCAPVFCRDVVRAAISIPADVEPQALITVGYVADEVQTVPLRKAFEDYVFFEGWKS
jgi:coenzyme F420-0:L-glutamate ligase/coenzyme F420-1:gamma-L-glutamate ligase